MNKNVFLVCMTLGLVWSGASHGAKFDELGPTSQLCLPSLPGTEFRVIGEGGVLTIEQKFRKTIEEKSKTRKFPKKGKRIFHTIGSLQWQEDNRVYNGVVRLYDSKDGFAVLRNRARTLVVDEVTYGCGHKNFKS